MSGMKPTDAAWMAGLFEGEGSIVFHGKNAVELVLSMTDEDVILRLQEVAGAGSVVPRVRPGIQKTFVWSVTDKQNAIRLLWVMLPWFGDRRGLRALAAIERLALCRDVGTAEVCGRGHSKTGDNLYLPPSGGPAQCKECRRVNARSGFSIYQLKEAENA